MIKIPITVGFNSKDVLGFAEIDETKLPEYPGFRFAIAYSTNDVTSPTDYKLSSLGLVPDPAQKVYD